MTLQEKSNIVKQYAIEHGFEYCGIAKAGFLHEDAKRLEKWLLQGKHGSMQYMENHFDLRVDPQKLVPGARSVITLLKNYHPATKYTNENPKISTYAWGNDYHDVIRTQLQSFSTNVKKKLGDFAGRGFVDSAPVLERTWAVKSGLGWIGKNGNFITKQQGSFFFIATLIVDIELAFDDPFAKDFCGSCTKCIDACPTDAIEPDKVVNGSKCISYFTIELKDALIPEEMKGKFNDWIFGCDICQDLCPWNRFSKPHSEKLFEPIPTIFNLSTSAWEEMTESQFKIIFKNSPLKRAKYKGLMRNLKFLST